MHPILPPPDNNIPDDCIKGAGRKSKIRNSHDVRSGECGGYAAKKKESQNEFFMMLLPLADDLTCNNSPRLCAGIVARDSARRRAK